MNLKFKLGKLDIETHMEYCYSDRICYNCLSFVVARNIVLSDFLQRTMATRNPVPLSVLLNSPAEVERPDILVTEMKKCTS